MSSPHHCDICGKELLLRDAIDIRFVRRKDGRTKIERKVPEESFDKYRLCRDCGYEAQIEFGSYIFKKRKERNEGVQG